MALRKLAQLNSSRGFLNARELIKKKQKRQNEIHLSSNNPKKRGKKNICLLYTSDAADE